MPNICWSSVWNLFRVTIPTPRIWRWPLDIVEKMYTPSIFIRNIVVTTGVVSTPLSPIYILSKPSGAFWRLYCGRKGPILKFPRGQGTNGSDGLIGGFVAI